MGVALPLVAPQLWDILTRCQQGDRPVCVRLEHAGHFLCANAFPVRKDDRIVGAALVCGAPGSDPAAAMDGRLRAILDSVSDGIWICDGDGTILAINAASERLNSLRAADYVGKNIGCIVDQHLVDRSATMSLYRHP